MGVSIQPGATALTRMPSTAHAMASDFVNWATPPLLAEYAGTKPLPKKLSIDAVFTTHPCDFAKSGRHAKHSRIVPDKFVSSTSRKSASTNSAPPRATCQRNSPAR